MYSLAVLFWRLFAWSLRLRIGGGGGGGGWWIL